MHKAAIEGRFVCIMFIDSVLLDGLSLSSDCVVTFSAPACLLSLNLSY